MKQMENRIFTQDQEELSRDAWKILKKRIDQDFKDAQKTPIIINNHQETGVKGRGSSNYVLESSTPSLFEKIRRFFHGR